MAYAASPTVPMRPSARGHIVDVLIEERAPRLSASPVWPVLRPTLYAILHYAKARAMADAMSPMGGVDALEYVSGLLQLKVSARGLERIPRVGRLVVVSNHPTGIGDGIALWDVLKGPRPDTVFYANADAHRIAPGIGDALIPVEWVEAKRTRDRTRITLTMTREAMEAERALVVFPAGRIARRQPGGGYADPVWATTAVSLARKHGAPILPVHMSGPTSRLFHFFNRFSNELRDVTLFHELLNKRGQAFQVTFGPAIDPQTLVGEAGEETLALKTYIERRLPVAPDEPFR